MGSRPAASGRIGSRMDTPLVIRPKLWLLFGAIAAIILAPTALYFVPNPFDGLAAGERPSRFFATLWVALSILILAALWRLLAWTSYRATRDWIETRSILGVKRLDWTQLTSSTLETPVGMPPAYELRFGKRKVRFIAAHHDRARIQALRAMISR